VFLRALVAPFYLLAASVLALLAALGLTVWIFQGALGDNSLVYYAPFVVAVVLFGRVGSWPGRTGPPARPPGVSRRPARGRQAARAE
jgi:hypothetical protein